MTISQDCDHSFKLCHGDIIPKEDGWPKQHVSSSVVRFVKVDENKPSNGMPENHCDLDTEALQTGRVKCVDGAIWLTLNAILSHLSHAVGGAVIGSTLALWLLVGQLASLEFVQGLEDMTQSIVVIGYLVIWSILSTVLGMLCLDNYNFSTDKMQQSQVSLVEYSYWAGFGMGVWIFGGFDATRYQGTHWQHGDKWAILALLNLALLGFLCAFLATKIMVDEKTTATTNKLEASPIVEEVQVPLLVV